jgi:hypothetical protein
MSEARDIANKINILEDSLYYFQTFAHALKEHHNDQAAAVFSDAAQRTQKEIDKLLEKIDGKTLPKIAPWEKPHPEYEHPSSLLMDADCQVSEEEAKAIVGKMTANHSLSD